MKKTAGAVLIILLVVIMSACSNTQDGAKKEAVKKISEDKSDSGANSASKPAKSSKEECMSGCFVMWKSNKSNEGKPESAMNQDCNSLCDASQGMQNADEDSCAKAEGLLKDTCYVDVAKSTNNPALCEKIQDKTFVSGCYIEIAEKTKDKSLCDKVPDKMMKETCLSE